MNKKLALATNKIRRGLIQRDPYQNRINHSLLRYAELPNPV